MIGGCGALPHTPAGRSSPCTPGTSATCHIGDAVGHIGRIGPIGRRLRRLGCTTFPFACGSTPLIGSNRRNRRFPILAELCGPLCLSRGRFVPSGLHGGCRVAMYHGFAGRALARVLWPWKVWRFAPHRRQGRRPGLSPLRLLQASKLPNFQASKGALCAPRKRRGGTKKGPRRGPLLCRVSDAYLAMTRIISTTLLE